VLQRHLLKPKIEPLLYPARHCDRREMAAKSTISAPHHAIMGQFLLIYLPFCNLLPKIRKSALGASIHSC